MNDSNFVYQLIPIFMIRQQTMLFPLSCFVCYMFSWSSRRGLWMRSKRLGICRVMFVWSLSKSRWQSHMFLAH